MSKFSKWWDKHITQPLKRAAPYITLALAIFAPGFVAEIGYSMGATTAANAAAAGSAALAGGTSLATGATFEQAARSAALAGIGSGAGSAAQSASGLTGTAGAAASGAASGATQAALTGQDVLTAAFKSGATAGLSEELQSQYKSTLPAEKANYNIQPSDTKTSGLGVKGTTSDLYSTTGSGTDPYGLKTPSLDTASVDTSGAADYSITPSGNSASDIGIQTAGFSSDSTGFSPTKLSSSDKAIADYIAKNTVKKLVPTPKSLTSQTSDVAMGSQASPTAAGAADVAMLDTTSPEGISGKAGKKGGKYPWGDPEGTTALKQEGQVV